MRRLILAWWIIRGRYPFWRLLRDRIQGRPNYAILTTGNGQYVYALHDPFTGKPFYVGRSNNPGRRYIEHVNERDSTKKSAYIEELLKRGAIPTMTIIQGCGSEDIEAVEKYWIRRLGRRHYLTNMTFSRRRK